MIELSNERIEKILNEETPKEENTVTILRSIYVRYMRMYERLFVDIDALNEEIIAELRDYHEETICLVKHFYLDIPQDICEDLEEFDKEYCDNLLGSDWHEYIFEKFNEFKDENFIGGKSEECLKSEFAKQTLSSFYDVMDYVFRDSFGTNGEAAQNTISEIAGMLFGRKNRK